MIDIRPSVRAVLIGAVAAISVSSVHAEDIIGRARVVDGDTIEIGKTRIRLFGIDAPEGGQRCAQEDGAAYDCGAEASRVLTALVARGTTVCDPKDIDRFKRPVAICYTRGLDLGAELVFAGWAVAFRRYSDMYIALEDHARQAKRGMWAGAFQMPWDWRRAKPTRGRTSVRWDVARVDLAGSALRDVPDFGSTR